MTTWIVTFGAPRDISDPGLDGREVRFPFEMIEEEHIGTPRKSVNTTRTWIDVRASGTLLATWGLADDDVVKVLFQIAKEHIEALLKGGESILDDGIKLRVDTFTHPGECPFDIPMIEEPNGAIVRVPVSMKIGFS